VSSAQERRGQTEIGEEMVERDYDAAIDRAFRRAKQTVRQDKVDRARTRKLVEQLELHGPGALSAVPPKGWEIPIVEALLERSWALRQEAPARMTELAEFAELATRRLEVELHGRARVADFRFRAWSELGNAYRISDRLEEAERAFDSALAHYLQGTRDKLLLARFLDFRASLHRCKREWAAAHQHLYLAYTIFRRHGHTHTAGRILINMAITVGYNHQPERAIYYIQRGLLMIDQNLDRGLTTAAIHNYLWFMTECGRFEEARKALCLNRHRYAGAPRLAAVKLRWLEARIEAGLVNIEQAEAGFREVKRSFEEIDLHYDAALAGLDLAALILQDDRRMEAHHLFFGACDTFSALGLCPQ
jgi:tetratricopeptide (TPR) repeat protein